ncbi:MULTISPECIES: very short patch repair endonuclease [Pseudomonas]|uniref:very short patch repair endonuclease n=1 Tax=Pseudomonas TaxID=286 RepID=UPI00101F1FC1|nr:MULTISPECIES: very short patch repair endonuclease [Pseudomonas]
MDTLTPAQRSDCMRKIKSHNTRPELIVRSICHQLGYRFRLGRKDLPGTPDLVFPRLKLCIFVHGCFWHRHSGCRYSYTPKTNVDFWIEKFLKNVRRDKLASDALESAGWKVEVVWECEVRDLESLKPRLAGVLKSQDL